jgi:hypothetical protein
MNYTMMHGSTNIKLGKSYAYFYSRGSNFLPANEDVMRLVILVLSRRYMCCSSLPNPFHNIVIQQFNLEFASVQLSLESNLRTAV